MLAAQKKNNAKVKEILPKHSLLWYNHVPLASISETGALKVIRKELVTKSCKWKNTEHVVNREGS